MFLLDTNVISEMRRREPSLDVRTWVENQPHETQFISVVSLMEIAFGAASHPDLKQQLQLQHWMNRELQVWFEDRVLDTTAEIARGQVH